MSFALNKLISTDDKKRLVSNFFALSSIQACNYILPLITLPYLVKTLGASNFGALAFATAICAYFIIITNYGFNLSATKEISLNRSNKDKVNEIYSSVMTVKLVLLLFCFIILVVLVSLFDRFSVNREVYYFTFGTVIAQWLLPVWLFQGMEKMKYITYLNITSKLIFTLSIFVFIKSSSDFYLVPVLNSMGGIFSGCVSVIIAYKKFDIKFTMQPLSTLKKYFVSGKDIFGVSALSNILSSSSIVILGMFISDAALGYYSAIEKLVKAVLSLFTPITQALFPFSARALKRSEREGVIILRKLTFVITFMAIIVLTFLNVFAKDVILLLFSEEFVGYSHLILLFTPWFILGLVNNMVGIQYLINVGRGNLYFRSFLVASSASIFCYFSLTPFFSYYGVLLGMNVGEVVLFLTMMKMILSKEFKNKINVYEN